MVLKLNIDTFSNVFKFFVVNCGISDTHPIERYFKLFKLEINHSEIVVQASIGQSLIYNHSRFVNQLISEADIDQFCQRFRVFKFGTSSNIHIGIFVSQIMDKLSRLFSQENNHKGNTHSVGE